MGAALSGSYFASSFHSSFGRKTTASIPYMKNRIIHIIIIALSMAVMMYDAVSRAKPN